MTSAIQRFRSTYGMQKTFNIEASNSAGYAMSYGQKLYAAAVPHTELTWDTMKERYTRTKITEFVNTAKAQKDIGPNRVAGGESLTLTRCLYLHATAMCSCVNYVTDDSTCSNVITSASYLRQSCPCYTLDGHHNQC